MLTNTISIKGMPEDVYKRQEDINPEAPMRIPDGYRYVSPEENLESICKSMLADASVNEAVSYTHLDVYKRQATGFSGKILIALLFILSGILLFARNMGWITSEVFD